MHRLDSINIEQSEVVKEILSKFWTRLYPILPETLTKNELHLLYYNKMDKMISDYLNLEMKGEDTNDRR